MEIRELLKFNPLTRGVCPFWWKPVRTGGRHIGDAAYWEVQLKLRSYTNQKLGLSTPFNTISQFLVITLIPQYAASRRAIP